MYEASWDWIKTRLSPELLPIAKAVVEDIKESRKPTPSEMRPGDVYTPPDETKWGGALWALARDLDTELDDIAPTQGDRDYFFLDRVYDRIHWDVIKALAMVEKGVWAEVPEPYASEHKGYAQLLKLRLIEEAPELPQKYKFTCDQVLEFAFARGRFVWGLGPYNRDEDPFLKR